MKPAQADAYLRRLGVPYPAWPTLEVLRELHVRHLRAVPFENLSVHLGEEIVLDEDRLVDKLTTAGRAGSATNSTAPSGRCSPPWVTR